MDVLEVKIYISKIIHLVDGHKAGEKKEERISKLEGGNNKKYLYEQ